MLIDGYNNITKNIKLQLCNIDKPILKTSVD